MLLGESDGRDMSTPLGVEGRNAECGVGRLVELLFEGAGRAKISFRGGNVDEPLVIRPISKLLDVAEPGRLNGVLSDPEGRTLVAVPPG